MTEYPCHPAKTLLCWPKTPQVALTPSFSWSQSSVSDILCFDVLFYLVWILMYVDFSAWMKSLFLLNHSYIFFIFFSFAGETSQFILNFCFKMNQSCCVFLKYFVYFQVANFHFLWSVLLSSHFLFVFVFLNAHWCHNRSWWNTFYFICKNKIVIYRMLTFFFSLIWMNFIIILCS